MPVVDASVVVAFLHAGDAGHRRSRDWWQAAAERGEMLDAPAILLAEVGAALARSTGDETLAAAAVELLSGGDVLELHAVDPGLARHAARIGIRQRVRGADAVYLALAQYLDEPLITLDRQQIERAGDGVEVCEPG